MQNPHSFHICLLQRDPQWFKPNSAQLSKQDSANWILVQAKLKKIFKLVSQYFETVLKQDVSFLEPNLGAMAKDADIEAIIGFARLILTLAVQCNQQEIYIGKIQTLDQSSQHSLMVAIESVNIRDFEDFYVLFQVITSTRNQLTVSVEDKMYTNLAKST